MKKISQEEFEQYVEAIINGEKSHTQVVSDLETEVRTLNNKIQELVVINPTLYKRYVEKFSYKPKERKDLDAMQLAIEILRQEKTIQEIAESHETGRRTIQRRIDTLRNSENPLKRRVYDLCKEVGRNNSRKGATISEELSLRAEQLLQELAELGIQLETKDKSTNVEERRQELLELERRYHELCATMSKEEAARALGYTGNRMNKLLNELYRIEIERGVKNSAKDFRQELKTEVEGINRAQKEITQMVEEKSEEKEIE